MFVTVLGAKICSRGDKASNKGLRRDVPSGDCLFQRGEDEKKNVQEMFVCTRVLYILYHPGATDVERGRGGQEGGKVPEGGEGQATVVLCGGGHTEVAAERREAREIDRSTAAQQRNACPQSRPPGLETEREGDQRERGERQRETETMLVTDVSS